MSNEKVYDVLKGMRLGSYFEQFYIHILLIIYKYFVYNEHQHGTNTSCWEQTHSSFVAITVETDY